VALSLSLPASNSLLKQTQPCSAHIEAVKESEKSSVTLGQGARLARLEKSLKLRPYQRELTKESVAVGKFYTRYLFWKYFFLNFYIDLENGCHKWNFCVLKLSDRRDTNLQ